MRRTVASLVVIATLLSPLTTSAVTVERTPAFAGVQAVLSLTELPAGEQIRAVLTSPSGSQSTVAGEADATGRATLVVPGTTIREAGSYTVRVLDAAGGSVGMGTLAVQPGGLDAQASALRASQQRSDEAEITVTLRDSVGNPLASRPVELIGSRLSDRITPLTRETDATGTQRFRVEAGETGRATFAAIDLLSSTVLLSRAEVTFGAGMAPVGGENLTASLLVPKAGAQEFGNTAAFTITAPQTVRANEPFTPRIEAVDAQGRRVLDYQGTVTISSPTDPAADLPGFGTLTFPARALGVMEPPLSTIFTAEGTQTLRVEDSQNAQIYGEVTVEVTGGDPTDPTRIQITSPRNGSTVGPNVEVRGTANPFSNLLITSGDQTATAVTDERGAFSARITIDITQPSVTITVEDEANVRRSGVVTVKPGTPLAQPQLQFSPQSPDAGGSVLAVVQLTDASQVTSVTLTVGDQPVLLDPSSVNPSLYQGSFTAPETPGSYPAAVVVETADGQTVTADTTVNVGERGIPVVENVSADPHVRAVEVRWSPVMGVDGYNVYVGIRGEDGGAVFQEPLRVDGADAMSARVEGLQPGTQYAFAVTARRGDRESPDKSNVVITSPSGLQLEVTPGAASLALQWNAPESQELLGYELTYGASPTDLTEKRTVAAQVQTLQLKDLLPGITYHLQLTPITVTGERLTELAAVGQGTPLADDGLHGSPDDTFDPNDVSPTTPTPPNNTDSGVPPFAWAAAAVLAAGILFLRLRKNRERAHTAAFLHAMEARYRG